MFIFLDIDGVMVHANPHKKVELDEDGFYKFNDKAVEILQSTIYHTKDKIVLSTSHRFKYNVKEWKDIFQRRGLDFKFLIILENKRSIPFKNICEQNHPYTSRKSEIYSWIQNHKIKSEEVLIIDDDKSLNDLPKKFKERLVLTNSYVGLNDQRPLVNVLNRRVKRNVQFENKNRSNTI